MAKRGRKPIPDPMPGHRTCRACLATKPFSELCTRIKNGVFYADRMCRLCAKQQAHEHYWLDPERARQKVANWRAANKELVVRRRREWLVANRDYANAYYREQATKLTDAYVRQKLCRPMDGSPRVLKAADIPQEMVEAKRIQILIKRKVKDEAYIRTDD